MFDVEQEIVNFINIIDNLLFAEVIDGVVDPVQENIVYVEGKKAVYKKMENMRIRNRFGEEIVKKRRTYYIPEEHTG